MLQSDSELDPFKDSFEDERRDAAGDGLHSGATAKCSAKIDALVDAQKEVQKHDAERWKASDERWARTEEGIRALLSIAEIHEREITTVGQGLERLTKEMLKLGKTTQATDDQLNVLINIVERHISDGRNGKP